MKQNPTAILITLILLSVSCVNTSHYTTVLQEADKAVRIHPDSTLQLLSAINNPHKLNAAQKADYGYLISRVHYKQKKAMAEDSLVIHSLNYFKETNNTDKLSYTYLLAAYYYKWRNNIPEFRNTIDEGIRFGIANGDSLPVSYMYYHLSQVEEQQKNYLQAINCLRDAIHYAPSSRTAYLYCIGLDYARINNDSADYYFQKSLDLALELKDTPHWLIRFIRRNYADYLGGKREYKESLALLYDNIKDYGDTAHISIARKYIDLGQLDSAQLYIDKLIESGVELYPTAKNSLMTIQTVIDHARNKPIDWGKQARYNDVLVSKEENKEKLLEEKIILKDQLLRQNLLLTIDTQQMQLRITWGILLFILALCAVVFYVTRKRKLLTEAEERQEVLENILKEVSEDNEESNRFAKKMILQQLGFIRIVANTPTSQNQQLLKQVSHINNSDMDAEHMLMWGDFYKVIDTVYGGFYSRLLATYETMLNEKEIQLCCLLCAGFSTKEISVLTGQKMQTIYQRKTTIRQKLQMDEKDDITDFIAHKTPPL